MFCTKCGKELKDSYKVCPYCGNKVNNGKIPSTKRPILLIVVAMVIIILICLMIIGRFVDDDNEQAANVSEYNTVNEDLIDDEIVEDELNMPGENQIEYDIEDMNEMMWEDLEYYADVYDNYESAYTYSETPEAEEFFANEDNLWYKSDTYQEWSTENPEDYRNITIEESPINYHTMQLGVKAKSGHTATIEFNPLPAKIGPNREFVYYFNFGGHYMCMTYFTEDNYIHIEDSKYEFDGDYRRIK